MTSHRLVFIAYPSAASGRRHGAHHAGSSSDSSRVHWTANQAPGPSLPLCIPISEVLSSSVKKHWRDRFNAIEVTCKDSSAFVFAIERETRNPLKENATVNTLRRIKEDLSWRREEDGFAYITDILRMCTIETISSGESGKEFPVTPGPSIPPVQATIAGPSSTSLASQPRLSLETNTATDGGATTTTSTIATRHHAHELDPSDEKRRNKARCNVCSGGVKKCTYHCPKCNWGNLALHAFIYCASILIHILYARHLDICETCLSSERMQMALNQGPPPALPAAAAKPASIRVPSPIPGPLSFKSASSVAPSVTAPSSSTTVFVPISLTGSDPEAAEGSIVGGGRPRLSSVGGVEDLEVTILDEPPIPYPCTGLQALDSEFDIYNDFRRQGLSKFYQW